MENLVICAPTCYSSEFLIFLLESWERFASEYKLLIVVDGDVDDNISQMKDFWEKENVFVEVIHGERSKAHAHNVCLDVAKNKLGADYIFLLNDDMVLGTYWDYNLDDYKEVLDEGNIVSFRLCERGEYLNNSSIISYDKTFESVDDFNLDEWEEFSNNFYDNCVEEEVDVCAFSLVFPILLNSKYIDVYRFNEDIKIGGGIDADFCMTVFKSGKKAFKLIKNLVFHFSCGTQTKLIKMGKWRDNNDIFLKKWGKTIGECIDEMCY
jgi:GT2 family glycosyltransferase